MAFPALLYFSHYLINGTIFEKKNVIDYKICVLILAPSFVWNGF